MIDTKDAVLALADDCEEAARGRHREVAEPLVSASIALRRLAPLLDRGEDLERDILDKVYDELAGQDPNFRDRVSARITDALLPPIQARIAQAEQAATERAALIADQRKAYWHDQRASKPNGWHVMLSSHEDEAGYIAAAIRARNTEEGNPCA